MTYTNEAERHDAELAASIYAELYGDDDRLESNDSRCYGCGGHCSPMRCPAHD